MAKTIQMVLPSGNIAELLTDNGEEMPIKGDFIVLNEQEYEVVKRKWVHSPNTRKIGDEVIDTVSTQWQIFLQEAQQ